MNCGPECGGTTASVQPLTIASGTAGTPVDVPGGATVGLLSSDGSTLYVAGTAGGTSANGALTVLSVPALSVAGQCHQRRLSHADGPGLQQPAVHRVHYLHG